MSEELKSYFENMFIDVDPNIKLDSDQINAIMNDDKYVLILAGAGTGKTTTMVGKVKYLVDIRHVDPSKILVVSYTKKAVQELQSIIIDKFEINTTVTTFHSLAYKYVRQLFSNRKCEVVDFNKREEIFFDYINEKFKQKKIGDLINTFNKDTLRTNRFNYGKYFKENYDKYEDYDSFFKSYKDYKLQEANQKGIKKLIDEWIDKRINDDESFITIQGELVKSAGEMVIANFLFEHGIDYSYEKIYEDIVDERKIYKPDFTLDVAGQKIYLEYFGMDDYNYNKIKEKKINFHRDNHNNFIYVDKAPLEEIEKILDYKLKSIGIVYNDRTDEEIYEQILDSNKLSQVFVLKNLFFNAIEKIKESINRDQYDRIIQNYIDTLDITEKEIATKQFNYINDFYIFYSKKLYNPDVYTFDFADLLHYTNKYIRKAEYLNNIDYEYIIIDEYQDISDGEYELARCTSNKSNAKIFAVGDDWQSIYAFRGSNIGYITQFDKYFEKPTILSIKNTYRNCQQLIDITGDFIKKNPNQIDKDLISFKNIPNPIHFLLYDDRIVTPEGTIIDDSIEYKTLERLVLSIHKANPKHSILILGRTNKMIDDCFKYNNDFMNDLGTKIKIASIEDLNLEGMTIHKAKGLTFDEVIIIGMNKAFPRDAQGIFWLSDLFKPKAPDEDIEFAEERRVFYVALTRTRNSVFILTNRNANHRSKFADELLEICKKNN